jgi:hypothetical protein
MSRDQVAGITSYISGGISASGLIYFAHMPNAESFNFRGQMALSRFAMWMAILAAVTLLGGFFRQDRQLRILTIIYGIGMCLLWVIIAAAHLPVA